MSRDDRGLQALPNEIFDEILLLLEPLPLVRLSSCSAPLRRRIQQDHRLWKNLYLRYFDYPVDAASTRRYSYPWRTEFEDFFSTGKLLSPPFEPIKAQVIQSVTRMISKQNINSKASLNLALLKDWFTPSSINYIIYFRRSTLHQWTRTVRSTSFATGERAWTRPNCPQWAAFAADNPYPKQTTQSQLSARLHCLYGPCIQSYYSASPVSAWKDPVLAACARSRVYDTRAYHHEDKRGPFFERYGLLRVDWELVEALLCILTVNIQRVITTGRTSPEEVEYTLGDSWTMPFAGVQRRSCDKIDRDVLDGMGITDEDPYGINGLWQTMSAELPQTNILVNYCRASQAIPPTQTGPPLFLREYCQPGYMELHVTKTHPRQGGSTDLPTVEIAGFWAFTCLDSGIANRHLFEGQVSSTEDGEIRWVFKFVGPLHVRTTINPQMKCTIEGVQIGGPNSARGVVGMLFPNVAGDLRYNCPVPFAFWKRDA